MGIQKGGRKIQTLDRTFSILEALEKHDGARVTELAERLSYSPSTVHNHLSTLRRRGYIAKEGDEYVVGLKFAKLGDYVRHRKKIYRRGIELVEALRDRTGLDTDFVVEENGRGLYLETLAESSAINEFPRPGDRFYLHNTAAGKAMLAQFTQQHTDRILDRWGLPATTDNTITDREVLFRDLERCRERGFALNWGENTEGIRAVGACLTNPNGTVLGGVSLSGPKYRISDDRLREDLPEQLTSALTQFEDGRYYPPQ